MAPSSVPPPPPVTPPHFGGVDPASAPTPLFRVDLRNSLGNEYAAMLDDIIRMVCIQLTIQVMLYFSGASKGVFTEDLVVLLIYVVLGVLFYWLVIRTLVAFH